MATTFSGEQQIEALYVGYFGRAGDPVGVNYWLGQLNGGLSIQQIAASFAVQTEATSMYPYLANPLVGGAAAQTNFINQIYQDLFGHAPDAAGLAYWQAQLTAANGSPQAVGQMVINIETGAQGSDATILQNKVTVGQFFTDNLAASGEQYNAAASNQAHSSVTGTTGATSGAGSVSTQEAAVSAFISGNAAAGTPITLTTGVDNVTGANLAISGLIDFTGGTPNNTTLQVFDTINPTGNNNSVTATVIGTAAALSSSNLPTLTNVQTLNITNLASATEVVTVTGIGPALTTLGAVGGTKGVSFAGFSGATTNTFNVTNQAGNTVTETFTAASGLSTSGAASGSAIVNLAGDTATGGVGTVTVVVAGNSATDGFATVTVNSNGAANDILALTDNALKTLNVAGGGTLKIDTALVFKGGIASVNAATDTGGLTLDISGNDSGKATFVGGTAGTEMLTIDHAELIAAGTSLTGGAGTSDTLVLDVAAALTSADYAALTTSTVVSGWEILGITDTVGTTVNAGTGGLGGAYTQFTLTAASTAATLLTGLANNSIINQLDGQSDTFAGGIGANTVTVNVGTATSAGVTITDTITSNYSTINLSSNTTGINAITLANNDGDVINVTGSSGTLTLAVGTATHTGDSINASAFTGTLNLTDSGQNDIISTGSGTTTITEQGTTLGDTITELAGHTKVDTLVSAADNNSGSTGGTKLLDGITNFALNQDTLKLAGHALIQGTSADMTGVVTGTGLATTATYSSAAQFIAAAEASTTAVQYHAVAYTDGTNTYVAEFTAAAGTANAAHIVELVGVTSPTAISLAAGAGHIIIG